MMRLGGRLQPIAAPLNNRASLRVSCRSRMSRLTAGWVTCIVVAADFTLPVTITARKASICLGLSNVP